MIVINIKGGLGNQMFQFAFGYSMARQRNTELKLDISKFQNNPLRNYELDIFSIDHGFASAQEITKLKYQPQNILQKLLRKPKQYASSFYKEKHFHFDSSVKCLNGDIYFDGYWQSEKYFYQYRQNIVDIYSSQINKHQTTKNYLDLIKNNNAVSIHIRRGDYVTDAKTNNVHGTCPREYYQKAVKIILDSNSRAKFYIFSDDLEWAKRNLGFIGDPTFVDLGDEIPDYVDMYLMSQCEHNIIANSSFSWWGAWLNQNPNKVVIAPEKWFRDQKMNTDDLIPQSWKKI